MTAGFVEDFPASPPGFDFDLIAEALVPLLEQPTEGALVLGIHGPWGSGKTTLLQAIRHEADQRQTVAPQVFVDFNAWKFHEREALWRALILRLLAELRPVASKEATQELDQLEQSLYRAFMVQEKGPWKVNWAGLVTEVITIGLSVIHLDFASKALTRQVSWLSKIFPKKKDEGGLGEKDIEQLGSILERTTTQRQVDQVQSIEQFLDRFRQVMGKLQADGRRVYVLIDDLDRCLPEDALDIFESIKLFLDAPGCVFLVALDREVIRKGLELRYGAQADSELLIDPDEYIEKTISISYDLPRLSDTDAGIVMDAFAPSASLSDNEKKLVIAGLGTNPRRVKRFMNTFSFHLRLAALAYDRQRPIPAGLLGEADPRVRSRFLKLLLISYRFSGIFALAFEDQALLIRLQDIANATGQNREQRRQALITEPIVARTLEREEEFWRLLRISPQFRTDDLSELLRWFRSEGGASS
ncbi:MAG: P-loop NTPase fold protein [Streptosporangiaceae bacterium]|jgi:hypothetical protein